MDLTIERCSGGSCKLKETCFRFISKPYPGDKVYPFDTVEDGCLIYWEHTGVKYDYRRTGRTNKSKKG